jgi:chromosome partitioning protein
MKTLVLANQKGGVGKSALATQLALYLKHQGKAVLVIDLDHQQNTSRPLRENPVVTVADFTSADVLTDPYLADLAPAGLVLIPGHDSLTQLERRREEHNAFATNLRNALKSHAAFDVCIIDTNPNPDIRYAAALISAGYVLAPIQLNQEALEGIYGLINHPRYGITRIRAALNPDLKFLGILPNLVEPTPFQRTNLQALAAKFGTRLLSRRDDSGAIVFGFIPKRSAVAEAQAASVFLPDLAKTAARDAWREIRPVFDMILKGMDIAITKEIDA